MISLPVESRETKQITFKKVMEKTLWSWQGHAKRQDKNKYF